jgi:hypothetical protein
MSAAHDGAAAANATIPTVPSNPDFMLIPCPRRAPQDFSDPDAAPKRGAGLQSLRQNKIVE